MRPRRPQRRSFAVCERREFRERKKRELRRELERARSFSLEGVPARPRGSRRTPHAFLETASRPAQRRRRVDRGDARRGDVVRARLAGGVRRLDRLRRRAAPDADVRAVRRAGPTRRRCRRALKGELASLRLSRQDASALRRATPAREEGSRGLNKATRDVLGALEAAEARLRALAVAATGPRANWTSDGGGHGNRRGAPLPGRPPAQALRSLSGQAGSHWVEAAEAAATAAVTAMRAHAREREPRRNPYAPVSGGSTTRPRWRTCARRCARRRLSRPPDRPRRAAARGAASREISEERSSRTSPRRRVCSSRVGT